MKTRIFVLVLAVLFQIPATFAQEKSTRLTKEQKKEEQEKKIEALMNSKEFVFEGDFAHPTGSRQVNLASNPNFMKFQPEMLESQMPFFGRAYSTTGYGTDTGVKFKAKPELYEIKKVKKGWDIEAIVSDQGDNFKIYLSVTTSGNGQLTITSNRRASISYSGEISAIQ